MSEPAQPAAQTDAQFMQSAVARLQAAALAEDAPAEGAGGGEPEAPAEAVKAAEKAAPQRGPGGKFVAAGKAEPPAAEPAKPAAKAAPEEPTVAKLEQLRALSKELGYTLEETRVSVGERAQFRQQRQQHFEQVRQLEAQAQAQAQAILNEANVRASVALKAQQAIDSGDFEAFAKALGRKDWNDLNREAIGRFADPNYRKVQELEAWKRQQEEQAQKAHQEARQRAQEQQRESQVQAYKAELSTTMAQSTDPLLAAFADDPLFIDAVFRVQDTYFDGNTTITPEEAVRIKPKNGGDPLFEEMRRLYSRLEKAFRAGQQEHEPAKAGSVREAQTPEPPKGGSGRDAPVPVRRTNTTSIPQRKATEAAGPGKFKDDREFLKYAERRMKEALLNDE